MDPIKEYHVKEQLYTRVVRYKSHSHLDIADRNVEIIQWYCSLKNLETKIAKANIMIRDKQLDTSILKWVDSVEESIINSSQNIETKLNSISHVFRELNKDSDNKLENLNDTCCIYGDVCNNLPKCESLDE